MMRSFKKIGLIILAVSVVTVGVIFGGVYLGLQKASNMKVYDLGGDVLQSVTALVGERKATGYAASVGTEGSSITIEYESGTVFDDLVAYTDYLTEEKGFIHTQDMNLGMVPGSTQLGAVSEDAGQIIVADIDYTDSRYMLMFLKVEGTLTPR